MDELRIETANGADQRSAIILDHLMHFNSSKSPYLARRVSQAAEDRYFSAFGFQDGGESVAGLLADIDPEWGWLHIEILWVGKRVRGVGLGARLVTTAEQEALRRGCSRAWLNTWTFQARGFYEKMGYRVVGVLEDWPPGQDYFTMRKELLSQNVQEAGPSD